MVTPFGGGKISANRVIQTISGCHVNAKTLRAARGEFVDYNNGKTTMQGICVTKRADLTTYAENLSGINKRGRRRFLTAGEIQTLLQRMSADRRLAD